MTSTLKLRFSLALLALISCLPFLVHSRFIEPRFDSLRSPATASLLPATFLFLRFFGQWSACFPVLFTGLFCWSFFRPAFIRLPFAIAVVFCIVFLVAYICYALLLIGGLLASRHA